MGATTNRLLKQKTAQLAAVREISRAIAEAQDLDTTLELITQRTAEVMGVQSCSLYLYDEQETALILAASTGLNQAGIGQMRLSKGEGLTGWAAEHSQLVAVTNAEADPRFHHMVGSGESQFASLMAMPLTTRSKVIGAANIQTTQHHTFSDDEIELFSVITDLAATAIEKARLVQDAVVREIHHRVKNNLQTIAMLLRLQVAQADGLTPEDILHETINRVLSIAAVHEILAHERYTHVGLKRLIKQVSQIIVSSMTIRGLVTVSVEGDDLQLPSQFATNLALITNELLQNALEHSLAHQKEGEIQIYLTLSQSDLLMTVTDNGLGLPHGFALESDSGLGLELIHTMVIEDLGGSFTLEAAPGGGARAAVNVPLDSIQE